MTLHRKLLSRNTFADPGFVPKGKRLGARHTRADILNLISGDNARLSRIGWTIADLIKTATQMIVGCTYVWHLLGETMFTWL